MVSPRFSTRAWPDWGPPQAEIKFRGQCARYSTRNVVFRFASRLAESELGEDLLELAHRLLESPSPTPDAGASAIGCFDG